MLSEEELGRLEKRAKVADDLECEAVVPRDKLRELIRGYRARSAVLAELREELELRGKKGMGHTMQRELMSVPPYVLKYLIRALDGAGE